MSLDIEEFFHETKELYIHAYTVMRLNQGIQDNLQSIIRCIHVAVGFDLDRNFKAVLCDTRHIILIESIKYGRQIPLEEFMEYAEKAKDVEELDSLLCKSHY